MAEIDEFNKVKELFHYFNIQTGIDSIFGNWAVSSHGDVVNILYPYVIFSFHLNDRDWVEELRKKTWFSSDNEEPFNEAFNRAKILLKIISDGNKG